MKDYINIVVLCWEDDDYYTREVLYIDDKYKLSVTPLWECPEDACIGRGLVSCSDIADYMKIAIEYAKQGYKIRFYNIFLEDYDEWEDERTLEEIIKNQPYEEV